MAYYDDQLRLLREQLAQKEHLEEALRTLKQQRRELELRLSELEQKLNKEEQDVAKLEGSSLSALFFRITGNLDERIDKEKQEAYEAKVRFDLVRRNLQELNTDVLQRESVLSELEACEVKCQQLLREKHDALRNRGGAVAAELDRLQTLQASLMKQKQEMDEAMVAAQSAQVKARAVLQALDDAEGWGVWDMMGGGLLADAAKHDALDAAQYRLEELQVSLRRLRSELNDVRIQKDLKVNLDGFTRFADFFFDGLFADWTVMDEISRSKQSVQSLNNQIDTMVFRLKQQQSTLQRDIDQNVLHMNELVENTSL